LLVISYASVTRCRIALLDVDLDLDRMLVVGVPEAAERVLGLARVAIPEDDPMCGIRPVPGPRTLSLMPPASASPASVPDSPRCSISCHRQRLDQRAVRLRLESGAVAGDDVPRLAGRLGQPVLL
jgi:hypothetical protein